MNTRLGNILYRAGLVGAAISVLYTVDVIWVHENGRSLLPVAARFVSREEMLIDVSIGVVLALVFWGAGWAARYIFNKVAEKQPTPK
jgi:type III secretory pathway component EscT